jgi:hypothetical protein
MSVASKAQVGAINEVTYGTAVVVTKFFDFIDESMAYDQDRMESASLRAQVRHLSSSNWDLGKVDVGGDISMELRPKGHGFWWNHAIGGVVSTQPNAGPDPTVWLHTFTPGNLPTSFTLQVAKPDLADVAQPFTYTGCRVSEWSLECATKEFAKMSMTVLGQQETTATALAVASYPTGNKPLRFIDGVMTIAGGAQDVMSVKLEGKNNLTEDRYFLGSPLRKQPLENALREITGTLETEFNGLTNYQRFISGTEAQVVLTFTGAIISGIFPYKTTITMNVRFDGETPKVGGPEVMKQPLKFKVVDSGTLSIKVEYQTTDTTP